MCFMEPLQRNNDTVVKFHSINGTRSKAALEQRVIRFEFLGEIEKKNNCSNELSCVSYKLIKCFISTLEAMIYLDAQNNLIKEHYEKACRSKMEFSYILERKRERERRAK